MNGNNPTKAQQLAEAAKAKAAAAKAGQPVTEQPVTEQPVTEQPVTEQPVTEQKEPKPKNKAKPSVRISARTAAELDRGREILAQKAKASAKTKKAPTNTPMTIITDTSDDPTGDKGSKTAESKAVNKS